MALAPAASAVGRAGPVVFLDTSVLLAGLVDFGPQSAPAQQVLLGVAER